MIITFSGLDGAGKSTQIDRLVKRFEGDKIQVKVLWARGGYTPLFENLKKALRKITWRALPSSGHSELRKKQLSNPVIQKTWLIIAIIDLIFFWGIYARVLSKLGYIVICDRYLQDTLLDFRQNFPSRRIDANIFWNLLELFTPKPNNAFLLWVPVELALERSIEKKEPFPEDKDVLEWRLASYMDEELFPSSEYLRIDGRMAIDEISDMIYKKIQTKLKKE